MGFAQTQLTFEPGLFANRSTRASQRRWVDGNLVRFPDGVPQQMGGWVAPPVAGGPVLGRARDMIAWRLNDGTARYAAIGTHSHFYRFDGSKLVDITPAGFTAGRADSFNGAGYGGAAYGAGLYGTKRVSLTVLDAAVWTTDMFGETLIACYSHDGKIYDFETGDTQLQLLAGAPTAHAICVSDERHVFAFGCAGDPGLVMWSHREVPTNWTPGSATRAGGYQMQVTSAFQCGKRCRGMVLAWTQTELFGFTPTFNSLVYDRDRLGTSCGAMGPHAVVVVTDSENEVAYWMSPHGFFIFDGRVQLLPCELFDYVYKDVNLDQRVKFQARANSLFGEIWFFYCGAGELEPDRAVVYDYRNRTWSKATISRLAWLDAGIFSRPLSIDNAGVIFEHETGDTANGAALPSFAVSHPMLMGVGQQFSDVAAFWPDMEAGSGSCTLTVLARDFPGAAEQVFGPYEFAASDEKVDLYISTRQLQLKISGVGGHWELGVPLLEVQAGGER